MYVHSLHFLMFFILFETLYSSRYILQLKSVIYHNAAEVCPDMQKALLVDVSLAIGKNI